MPPDTIILIIVLVISSVIGLFAVAITIGRWLADVNGRLDVPDGNEDHL